jgi:hypothetical protein
MKYGRKIWKMISARDAEVSETFPIWRGLAPKEEEATE